MEYFDIDGNPTTLEKLVTEQPAWACNRIRADRERIKEMEGAIKRHRICFVEVLGQGPVNGTARDWRLWSTLKEDG